MSTRYEDARRVLENLTPEQRRQLLAEENKNKPTQQTPSTSESLMEAGLSAGSAAATQAALGSGTASATAPTIVSATQAPAGTFASVAPSAGGMMGMVPGAAAALHGAYTANKFAEGDKLNNAEKLAYALPTGGLSLLSDNVQRALGSKSTDDYQAERWGAAQSNAASQADADWLANTIEQKAKPDDGVFDEGPLAGRKYDFREVERVARPEDLWGEYAFAEAFPDWISGFSEDQRRQIVQAALDEDLLQSDKGAVLASGQNGNLSRLQEIGGQVREGTYQPTMTPEEREAERMAAYEEFGLEYDPIYYEQPQPTEEQPQQGREPTKQGRRPRPTRRPAPMNNIPSPIEEPILPPPPPPPLKTPTDYAQAYVDVFRQNQGQPANPLLTGRY